MINYTNTLEAEQLLNTRIDNFSAFERAGKALFAMLNPIAVSHKNTYTRILLKGGHLPASPIVRDVLSTPRALRRLNRLT